MSLIHKELSNDLNAGVGRVHECYEVADQLCSIAENEVERQKGQGTWKRKIKL